MPELPEVESVARGLAARTGNRLLSLELIDPKLLYESELPPEALAGSELLSVSRRAKYLCLRFSGGASLIAHLRMTGKFLGLNSRLIPARVRNASGGRPATGAALQLRAIFHFATGEALCFFDPRRFGTFTLVSDEGRFFRNKGIAPDPLHDPEQALGRFLAAASASRKPIKALLLDQRALAGVGNIYADEALHACGLSPRLPAHRLREPERLWRAVLSLFRRSIRLGGTTILDYVNADGREGRFARSLKAYGREGEPCRSCDGGKILRVQLAGRSTFFCPRCQPLSRREAEGNGRSRGRRSTGRASRPS